MLNHPTYPCIPTPCIPTKVGNQCPSFTRMNHWEHWVPAFAGMIGLILVGCASEKTIPDKTLVCAPQVAGHETLPISVRLSEDVLSNRVSKLAEVSYGISPKSANYIETSERYTITLPSNETFPECIITIDRLSGYAKHLCLGKSEIYPNDIRSQTFELTCEAKLESL